MSTLSHLGRSQTWFVAVLGYRNLLRLLFRSPRRGEVGRSSCSDAKIHCMELYCHSGEITSFGRIQNPSCKSTPSPKPQRHHRHVVEMACDLINLWEHQVVSNNHRLKPMSGNDPGRLKSVEKVKNKLRKSNLEHLQVFSLSDFRYNHMSHPSNLQCFCCSFVLPMVTGCGCSKAYDSFTEAPPKIHRISLELRAGVVLSWILFQSLPHLQLLGPNFTLYS